MSQFKIGAMVESFRLDTFDAIRAAARLGVDGLQMYCTRGDNAPENMTASRKKDIMTLMKDEGLCFSAICGDLGHGFGNAEMNPELIEKSKRIVDLALDLGTNIVTTHIGVVPTDSKHPRYAIMQEACGELARYADSMGAHFAVETGPEHSKVLKGFLDSLGSTGVGVNLDPANLAMVIGENAAEAVHDLSRYIVHTHAKDGVMLTPGKPEIIYGVEFCPEDERNVCHFREVPLGQGHVDFDNYFKALKEIGYRGFLTIEREVGENPAADIALAVDFLREKTGNL